jgi:hypothetical protein
VSSVHQKGGDYTRTYIQRSGDHWGHFRRLSTQPQTQLFQIHANSWVPQNYKLAHEQSNTTEKWLF